MFHLLTDPTADTPKRKVDLRETAGKLNVVPILQSGSNQDDKFIASNKDKLRIIQPKKYDLKLDIDYMDEEAFHQFIKIYEEGSDIYAFPNFDHDTMFWAPLHSSTYALIRDPATDRMVKTAGTFTRASTAWKMNTKNEFESVATGVPRFGPGPFGDGITIEAGFKNLQADPHPSSGTLVYTNTVGVATLSWDTEVRSPKLDAGGAVKVEIGAGAGTVTVELKYATGDATASNDTYLAGFWVKNTPDGILKSQFGGVVETHDTVAAATDGQWQELKVMRLKDDTGALLAVFLEIEMQAHAQTFWLGPCFTFTGVSAVTIGDWTPHNFWTDRVAGLDNVPDLLEWDFDSPLNEYTASVLSLSPEVRTTARIFRFNASDNTLIQWVNIAGTAQLSRAISGGEAVDAIADNALYVEGIPSLQAMRAKALASTTTDTEKGLTSILQLQGQAAVITTTATPALLGTNGNKIQLGEAVHQNSGESRPNQLRIDSRAWGDLEWELHRKMMLQTQFRNLLKLTTGRKYTIADHSMKGRSGNFGQYIGSVLLEQVSSDPDFIVMG